MRVALIRGSLLRPWEPPNYRIDGVAVEAFASRRVASSIGDVGIPVHGLRSTGDPLARMPPLARAAVDHFGGTVERLSGLEDAVRGFDIAHALELANPLTAQALDARDAGACRAVVATVMENIPFRRAPNRRVAERSARVAREVDHFIAITERARLHLQTAGVDDDRITVLPLGIDVERFRPADADRSPERPRVVTVARLEAGKGVEDLVIAAGLLVRRGVDLEVALVGEGPLRDHLLRIAGELGIADRVRVEGPVDWRELERVHHGSDIFVLASAPTANWREQFGFAVVEAMACGLPVVVGASGSLPEVVADADSLVAPHDPLGLAAHLERLVGDPELRRRQGERNRAWAVERYDERRIAERLGELYRSVLAGRTARQA